MRIIRNVRMAVLLGVLFLCGLGAENAYAAQTNSLEPEVVSFRSGELTLEGYLYKPRGKGPFPAMIYNHGSNKVPGTCAPLGEFWSAHGFIFFFPHRSGHGRSPGEWIVEAQQKFQEGESDTTKAQKHAIELHERANLDVEAAVRWLKQQSFVDTNQIIMSGVSYGGIQTVLAAEKDLGVKAFIPFAPAAMSWRGSPLLRERLLVAVKKAKSPTFLIQAQNDYNLGPSDVLGGELKRKGLPNRSKVYPAFGDPKSRSDGHGSFAIRGSDVWGVDVLAFVNGVLEEKAKSSQ